MDNSLFQEVVTSKDRPTEEQLNAQAAQQAQQAAQNSDVKRGRGRPRKDGSTTHQNKKPEPSMDDLKRQVEKKEKEFEAAKETLTAEAAKPENNPFAGLIDGYMVILVMNVLFPTVIKFLFAKKFKEIKHEEIALNKMQQESMQPLADHVANYIVQFINPLVAFALVSSLMYYQNAVIALETKPKTN